MRALAAAIDAVLALGVALALSSTLGEWFAERAVVTLRIGQPGTWWRGPIPLVLGVFGEVVYGLPFAGLLVWSLAAQTGGTLGKRLLGLRVRDAGGGPAVATQRLGRTAILTVGLWGSTLALVAGSWQLALVACSAAAIVLLGTFTALGPAARALHDRLSGTVVVRFQ